MDSKIFEIKKGWIKETVEILEKQMAQAILEIGDEGHESFSLAPISLGYLFGFCSRGLEFHNIDLNLEKLKILIQVYSQLFGQGGHDILEITFNFNHEEHKQFYEGVASGREEFFRWFHHHENPSDLLRHIVNGEKTKSMISQGPYRNWNRNAAPLAV